MLYEVITEPENVGFPFNSPANDYMMVIDDLHNRGWFATDRNQPAGKVVIYEFLSTDDKVFVHTDDSVLLRNKAALKTYRKAQVKKENALASQPVELKDDTVAFRVVINDSTVYTHQSEFVIPSYSIHYTKLYEKDHALFFCGKKK